MSGIELQTVFMTEQRNISSRSTTTNVGNQPLNGKVAWVAGATRGAGRAIALELARAGAFVYCTGRSTSANPSDYGRTETIEGTLALIEADGGAGEAIACDHLVVAELESVVHHIDAAHSRLDILINDIGGEAYVHWGTKFWDSDFETSMRVVHSGLLTHLNTAHAALTLLVKNPGGVSIEITDGTTEYNRKTYRDSVYLDITKTAVSRLAFALGHELESEGCTALAVTPGWLRSEMMLDTFSTNDTDWLSDSLDPSKEVPPADFAISETPAFLARGIVAVVADPQVHRFNTTTLSSFELANIYGFDDVDGSRPDSWGFIAAKTEEPTVDYTDFR